MVAAIVLSAIYVMFLRSETWSARQSLIVRDDLLGQSYKPGRFESLESMKSAQETILEIARKPQVIRNAMQKLGPEPAGLFGSSGDDESWPSEKVIESVQGTISLSAPNGAEFGRTEVIILNAKASSRERSREFIGYLMDEIIAKTGEVRATRLHSMEDELSQAYDTARLALEQSKDKLRSLDRQLGPDVDVMNALSDPQGTSNPIKNELSQIGIEKRSVESEIETAKGVLEMLIAARDNPEGLVNISSDLTKHQPTLSLLQLELVKAKGALAKISSLKTDEHPEVKGGKNELDEIQQYIYRELDNTIEGMRNDIAVLEQRGRRLDDDIEKLETRLISLGEQLADYSDIRSEVRQRNETFNKIQADLAEIQGLAASTHANLLTPVGEPQVSTTPDELGKKASVLAAGFGGLMLGLGLVMLVAPPSDLESRVQQSKTTSEATPKSTRKSSEAAKASSKPVAESAPKTSATPKQTANRPKRDSIQIVPVKKVQQIPIQRVPDKTVAATPERKAKPTTETLIVAPSVDDKAAQSGPAPVDRTTSTMQPPVKAQAPASGSAMDKAFEFPIEEEVDAIQKTETPTARAESQTVTLEDFEPGHPPTKADKADKPATATPASRQGRRAIVVGPDHPSTELKRRQSSVRPVDLIKSVESEIKDSMFVTTDRATDSDQVPPISASTDPAADSAF